MLARLDLSSLSLNYIAINKDKKYRKVTTVDEDKNLS